MMMKLINLFMNVVVPPASLLILAFAWPTLKFLNVCEWIYNTYVCEDMDHKVVIITGASSGIGELIAYEYAKRGANLVLVARRENRLHGISENARQLGSRHVLIMAADVVKEEDCIKFVNETINVFGQVDHLVNTATLGHTFYFEEATDTAVFPIIMDINFWGNVYPTHVALPYLRQNKGRIIVNASVENWLPLPRMSLYAAAKAAVTNFYESLRFEVGDDVRITVATHGWIGTEMSRGRFMVDEGAEMQWKEEREDPVVYSRGSGFPLAPTSYPAVYLFDHDSVFVQASGGPLEEYARQIVSGACRGDSFVKYTSWYDVLFLYKIFAPNVLQWTFRLLLMNRDGRRTSLIGTGRPILEGSPSRN